MKILHYITKAALVLTMVTCMITCATTANAQPVPANELHEMLARNFQMLKDNRRTYNRYNDSIFIIRDRDLWISFFQRRAWKVKDIYENNKRILQEIEYPFRNDSIAKKPDDYSILYSQLVSYSSDKTSDPFIFIHLGKILEQYYESGKCPDRHNNAPMLYCNMAYNYYNIFMLGNDSTYAKTSYNYLIKAIDEKNKDLNSYLRAQMFALSNLSTHAYYRSKAQTLKEYNKYAALFKQIMQLDTIGTGRFRNDDEYKEKLGEAMRYESSFIRNVYLTDSTIMPKQKADSIMRSIVDNAKPAKQTSFTYWLRNLVMKVKLGDLTYDEALKEALDRYDEEWRSKYQKERLTPSDLASYMTTFYTLFYFNDMASTSEAQKRKLVKRMCRDIESAYSRRIDQQTDNRYIRYLNTLTTYKRITNHLTPAERIHFLNTLNVATQVTTYAHSVHVGTIAVILTQSIIDSKPELLIGMLGCQSAKEVKKKAHRFIEYVYHAALYHDLGKNSIVSVVTNDYRPLYDEEYAIIKRHPELGLQFLELAPELAQYHDTTLGHHKWYNGKGGYPDSFDNTHSPYRTLIDIITLSDCMQAATERVGRNYRGEKTFDAVMEEFRKDAGTRYNPDLVRFIDEHPQVANTLRFNLNRGWLDIYYNIYQNFME